MKLNSEQVEILDHTFRRAPKGLYCGNSDDMQALVREGLMESAGRKSFVPDEYFRITEAGLAALNTEREKGDRHAVEAANHSGAVDQPGDHQDA